jgi:hypothetical protein
MKQIQNPNDGMTKRFEHSIFGKFVLVSDSPRNLKDFGD